MVKQVVYQVVIGEEDRIKNKKQDKDDEVINFIINSLNKL